MINIILALLKYYRSNSSFLTFCAGYRSHYVCNDVSIWFAYKWSKMLTKKLAPCLKRFSIFQLTKCHQKTSVFTKCPRDPQKWTIAPALPFRSLLPPDHGPLRLSAHPWDQEQRRNRRGPARHYWAKSRAKSLWIRSGPGPCFVALWCKRGYKTRPLSIGGGGATAPRLDPPLDRCASHDAPVQFSSVQFSSVQYRKASCRGAHGQAFWSVFEEYPLDSTRSDCNICCCGIKSMLFKNASQRIMSICASGRGFTVFFHFQT